MARRATPVSLVLALFLILVPGGNAAAAPEPTIENPIVVESFDGTPIVGTLMLPARASARNPVPVVLETHGWGGTRRTAPGGLSERLLDAGYAIFTWDARGFGDSGGEANIDSPEFEVKDVQALMDYLASRKEILKDGPKDPRLGWIGGSYAGGIQLNTAGIDHRPDAIVPEISWADLVQDLYPNDVLKRTWDQLLYAAGAATGAANGLDSPAGPQTGVYAQQIHQAYALGTTTGTFPDDLRKWFFQKSTILRAPRITTPTMIVQGTVDTLFPLEDGFALYDLLTGSGTPVKLLAYCGGHTLGGCSYPGGTSGYPDADEGDERAPFYQDRIVAWLDRYVKGLDVDTGPEFEWQAQDGYYYGAPRYRLPDTQMSDSKAFEIQLVGPGPGGGDGLADGNPAPQWELGVTAMRKEIVAPVKQRRTVVGMPLVFAGGSVTGATAFLFFELVDQAPDGTLTTVDDQTMPLRFGAETGERTFEMHGVSWILEPGHSLLLEITTGSTQYDIPRTGPYAVSMSINVSVPMSPFVGRATSK